MKIHDGLIIEHNSFNGIYVLPLAICLRDSAFDYPAFLATIELWDTMYPDGTDPTMYPDRQEIRRLAKLMDFHDAAEELDFLDKFPLDWST